jgi:N-acyl-D-aspartate/D-glutamate deacylase
MMTGTIYDGTGSAPVTGNVVINEDRIAAIGPDVAEAGDVIDVSGLAVSPGFIEMHSHCDLVCMSDPQIAPKLMQGITLELVGQDGLSEAPIKEEDISLWRRHLSGLNGDPDLPWDWRSFGEYLARCEGASTNIAAMVGHGTVRLHAMGMDNRLPTEAEMQEMRRLVDRAIQEGAIGFSTGLIYSPCVYCETEEMISIGEIVAQHGSFMVYHMRFEGNAVLTGMDEVFTIARQSGASCHISHFKAMDVWQTANPDGKADEGWLAKLVKGSVDRRGHPFAGFAAGGMLPPALMSPDYPVPAVSSADTYKLLPDPRYAADAPVRVGGAAPGLGAGAGVGCARRLVSDRSLLCRHSPYQRRSRRHSETSRASWRTRVPFEVAYA